MEKEVVIRQARSSPENLKLALIVHDALSELRDQILVGFLAALERSVEKKVQGTQWKISKRFTKRLWNGDSLRCSRPGFAGSVAAEFNKARCADLFYGVAKAQLTDPQMVALVDNLNASLWVGNTADNRWHWWHWADDRVRYWDTDEVLSQSLDEDSFAGQIADVLLAIMEQIDQACV